jgi:DNA-binding CsgD family transcriptional regulator/ketosteroid isomerase-like protein
MIRGSISTNNGFDAQIELVRRTFDAFNERDFDALADLMSPDLHVVPIGVFAPPGATYHGAAGFESLLDAIVERHGDVIFEPAGFRQVGDFVILRAVAYVPGESSAARHSVFLIEVDDGRIVRIEGFRSEREAIAAAERDKPVVATRLTPREREIFGLLAQGLSGVEIAAQLVLSRETVRTHIQNGISRLGARTRVEAVVRALKRGEIDT